jgi:hypothetical protein
LRRLCRATSCRSSHHASALNGGGQAALGLTAAKRRFCGADTQWRSIAKVRARFDRDRV